MHPHATRALSLVAALCAAGAGLAALAQQAPAADEAEIEATLERQRALAVTRPRTDAPPVGVTAERVERRTADWRSVRETIARTEERDAAAASPTVARVAAPRTGLRAAPAERLPRVRAAEVVRTGVPVLIPSAPGVAESVQVFGQENAYTAVAQITDGPAVRMSGTRNRLVVRDRQAAPRLQALRERRAELAGLDASYVIGRSDTSTDLSFSKFDCGYVLSLMCDDPEDARCAEDEYIVSLARSLVILNADAGGGE